MDKMLAKLMEKKKSGKLSDGYKKAKMSVLENLHKDMSGMLSDDVKGLKKVTVASKDTKGLKEGLNKAEEMISGPNSEVEENEEDQEMASDEENSDDDIIETEMAEEDMSVDELEAKIAELEALKAKKMNE